MEINKIVLIFALLSIVLISGCNVDIKWGIGKISKDEAERLAVNEVKEVFRNIIISIDDKDFEYDSKEHILAEFDKMSWYALYSAQKGEVWVVYVTSQKFEELPLEIYVYSKENIQIPKLEEMIKTGGLI